MNELASLLQSANEPGSENVVTLDSVRTWLASYLRTRDEEIARFPEEVDVAHWDLALADFDSTKDGTFVLSLWQGASVVFLVGRGRITAVRDFADNSFPTTPSLVPDELSRRFTIVGRVEVNRDEVLRWVQSARHSA